MAGDRGILLVWHTVKSSISRGNKYSTVEQICSSARYCGASSATDRPTDRPAGERANVCARGRAAPRPTGIECWQPQEHSRTRARARLRLIYRISIVRSVRAQDTVGRLESAFDASSWSRARRLFPTAIAPRFASLRSDNHK